MLSAETFLIGESFLFTATMDAPIGTTDLAFYVWGLDRGTGATTANFASGDGSARPAPVQGVLGQ